MAQKRTENDVVLDFRNKDFRQLASYDIIPKPEDTYEKKAKKNSKK